ncbi:type VII toxin-antitoxin system MntA family adenylyltransferase antitoxin [Thermithiobacillus plumbiphilus]|uniref:Nucleotidyltransferase domain-containing protein n=1 Tax=Thermithiobacillus plumbiphilus TaxID=1729899 RepID=A0ABU9D535_9PROT
MRAGQINGSKQDLSLEQNVLAAIRIQPEIGLVILFGSLARGQAHAQSDLDLAVDAGRPLTASEKMDLINELAVRTGRPIDLVDLRAIGEPLLGQILRHGKRLLGSDTQYANLIRRHLFDQADYLPYRDRILAERRRAWIGK